MGMVSSGMGAPRGVSCGSWDRIDCNIDVGKAEASARKASS